MKLRNTAPWLVLACALSLVLGCGSRQKASWGAAKEHVGAAVTVQEPVVIAKLAENPADFDGKTVRLQGTVKAVCQGMGCWVEVQDADGKSFLARSLDESILLPKDCAGRRIVVQGVVMTLPKAAAEEPMPADHACPRPSYVVATQGVELY